MKARVKRIPMGSLSVSFVVQEDGEERVSTNCTRAYADSIGNINVAFTEHEDERSAEMHLDTYTYNGRPLSESWPAQTGRAYNKPAREMVGAALALARLGYADMALEPRQPPNPDLFVTSRALGDIAIEVTSDIDPEEAMFQRAMEEFVAVLAGVQGAAELPYAVGLAFVRVPARSDYNRIALDLLTFIKSHASEPGVNYFSGELSHFFAQYIIQPKGNGPTFRGGGVVNVRGYPDYRATTLRQIEQKRDGKNYELGGRSLWLVVGISTAALFMPNFITQLYEANLELGKLDTMILSASSNSVRFKRVKSC